jgi:aspartate aminotransferase
VCGGHSKPTERLAARVPVPGLADGSLGVPVRLDRLGERGEAVREQGDGSPIHPDSFSEAFKRIARKAGLSPKTRLLILNSPANPTGGVTPRGEIEKLVKGLEAHPHVAVMSDEIYDVMTYDGEKHTSLLTFPEIRDRLIVLNGWSKTWAMTGWRMGWSIWPDRLYDKVRKMAVNCWSCVNAPSQFAGIAAIDGPQDEVEKMMAAFDRRRKLVVEGLNALPGISCITPKGAFYAFPNVKETGWKAKELASALLEEAGVALIGGPDFGVLGEGYVRLSYANSEENIERALARIGSFLEQRKA